MIELDLNSLDWGDLKVLEVKHLHDKDKTAIN